MASKVEWEEVDGFNIKRLKVPGGWLVVYLEDVLTDSDAIYFRPTAVYIPDATHEWLKEVTNE